MDDDVQGLPHLDELRRTQLLLRFQEMPRGERGRLRRATSRGRMLDTHEERLMQYALLGQNRRFRLIYACIAPLMCVYAVGRALNDGSSTWWVAFCVIAFVPPAVIAPWVLWRTRRLERRLGLTADSFR